MSDGTFFDEKQLLQLGWPLWVVQAVKRIFESEANEIIIRVDENEENIEINKESIDANKESIDANAYQIGLNAENISSNSQTIEENAQNIEKKADKISSPIENNLINQDSDGNIKDAGVKASDYETQVGDGSPEGVVSANRSRMYIDKTTGSETLYFNAALGSNTGWLPV
jgi:hypothetical protein